MQHPVGTPDRVFFVRKNGEPALAGQRFAVFGMFGII